MSSGRRESIPDAEFIGSWEDRARAAERELHVKQQEMIRTRAAIDTALECLHRDLHDGARRALQDALRASR